MIDPREGEVAPASDQGRAGETGLLLVNLGTPDAPETRPVRRYLREFLGDPRVLDIHPAARAALLHGVILPFRPAKSAHAYRQIWTEAGSPLLVHGRNLRDAVAAELGEGWRVELAMRYGAPSLADAVARLRSARVGRIVLFPLYPQYASASTGTTVAEVFRLLSQTPHVPPLAVVPPFPVDPAFLEAWRQVGEGPLREFAPDHVLFSFHGLPERQVRAADPTGAHCLSVPGCCDAPAALTAHCYRAQCFATARGIAGALGLDPAMTSVAFQSRLGRDAWLLPATDRRLAELPGEGVGRLAVFCPAFVADCLETSEEIGIRGRAAFLGAGGESLRLVPSLNDHPAWVRAVAALARAHAGGVIGDHEARSAAATDSDGGLPVRP